MTPRTRHRLLITATVAAALAGLVAYAAEHRRDALSGGREDQARTRLSVADGASRAPLRGGVAVAPAGSSARPAKVGPMPSLERKMYSEPASRRALVPAQRSPHYAAPDSLRLRYGDPARADALARPSQRQFLADAARRGAGTKALGVCSANDFRTLSGTALVDYIKSISPDCIHQTLFSIGGTAAAETFSEAKMTTVANAIRTASQAYAGNNSGGIIQLVTFMRAGYYVNFYDDAVPAYSSALTGTVKTALDPFFAKSPWLQVNDANAEVLSEILVLADSSENQHSYLWVAKEMMANFGDAHAANRFMSNAMINVFNLLFRGQWNESYKAAVRADPSIVDATYNFTIRNWSRLGTANAYHVTNAARELTRFVSQWDYPSTSVETLARTRLKDLITRAYGSGIGSSPNLTVSAPTYGLLVSGVDYYDREGCTPYGTCNAAQQVEAAVLTLRHTCPNNANYRIRAMNLTATQLTNACNLVVGQEAYFHGKFGTAGRPVANDNNTTLEINVFDDSTAYGDWAGIIFGIDTNNGGMYLEGDPAAAGNQARFVAYEASDGSIWNLTHEFVHYLDGRYNKYGGFKSDGRLVWWVEGIAEYISYGYENRTNTWALDLAGSKAYALSTLFDTSYAHGQDRIYAWGYLASRYMMEFRRPNVDTALGYLRTNQYATYTSYIGNLGTNFDADFASWLGCVKTGCGTTPNVPPVANFSVATSNLTATFTDSSTDSDGSIASRAWNFGDGTSSTATNPSKTYASAGTYTVTLTVTDNRGATATRTASVTVSAPPSGNVLANGVPVSGLSGARGAMLRYTLVVPAGATNLKFVTTGSTGSGDVDLYAKFGTAPTTSSYDCRGYTASSNETCAIANAQAGTYHVLVHGYSAFSGVTLTGSYGTGSTNASPVANFGVATNGLTATFTDGSSDSDGSIVARSWNFGDGSGSTVASPTKTYAAAGTYTVTLTVTDDKGATATKTQAVTVVQATPTLPECTASDVRVLERNCKRSNVAVATGGSSHFYMSLPAGVSQLKITVSAPSGTGGNVDLYYKAGGWAYTTDYTLASRNSGNAEVITIANPPSGFVGIMLQGVSGASGLTISAEY